MGIRLDALLIDTVHIARGKAVMCFVISILYLTLMMATKFFDDAFDKLMPVFGYNKIVRKCTGHFSLTNHDCLDEQVRCTLDESQNLKLISLLTIMDKVFNEIIINNQLVVFLADPDPLIAQFAMFSLKQAIDSIHQLHTDRRVLDEIAPFVIKRADEELIAGCPNGKLAYHGLRIIRHLCVRLEGLSPILPSFLLKVSHFEMAKLRSVALLIASSISHFFTEATGENLLTAILEACSIYQEPKCLVFLLEALQFVHGNAMLCLFRQSRGFIILHKILTGSLDDSVKVTVCFAISGLIIELDVEGLSYIVDIGIADTLICETMVSDVWGPSHAACFTLKFICEIGGIDVNKKLITSGLFASIVCNIVAYSNGVGPFEIDILISTLEILDALLKTKDSCQFVLEWCGIYYGHKLLDELTKHPDPHVKNLSQKIITYLV